MFLKITEIITRSNVHNHGGGGNSGLLRVGLFSQQILYTVEHS